MTKTSPTQRSLAYCRKNGWTVAVVERWNPFAKIRQDLFGCIDILVLDDLEQGPLAAQVTSGSGHSARKKKSLLEPRLEMWLKAPARFEVWSWSLKGPAGKRKLWTLRREPLTLMDFQAQNESYSDLSSEP